MQQAGLCNRAGTVAVFSWKPYLAYFKPNFVQGLQLQFGIDSLLSDLYCKFLNLWWFQIYSSNISVLLPLYTYLLIEEEPGPQMLNSWIVQMQNSSSQHGFQIHNIILHALDLSQNWFNKHWSPDEDGPLQWERDEYGLAFRVIDLKSSLSQIGHGNLLETGLRPVSSPCSLCSTHVCLGCSSCDCMTLFSDLSVSYPSSKTVKRKKCLII